MTKLGSRLCKFMLHILKSKKNDRIYIFLLKFARLKHIKRSTITDVFNYNDAILAFIQKYSSRF